MSSKLSKELEELSDILKERDVDLDSAICIVLTLQNDLKAQMDMIKWLKSNQHVSTDEIMEYVFAVK